MTDRDILIHLKDQIEAHLNKGVVEEVPPVEEPEEGSEEEVPTFPVPATPISNFKAVIQDTNHVLCTWEPHAEGVMDIEFYRPEVDKTSWRHSVTRYVGAISISAGHYLIWMDSPSPSSKFRPKVGTWTGEAVTPSIPPAPVVEPTPEPEPVVEEPEPIVEPTPTPVPEFKGIELLVYFVNHNWVLGRYVDINVNGIWYRLSELNHDSPEWDVKVAGARGMIFKIPEDVKSIAFDFNQVNFPNLRHNGYGMFFYKVGAKAPDYDLKNPLVQDGLPNSWATWYRLNNSPDYEYAYLVSPLGMIGGNSSTSIHGTNILPEWNNTGKMAVILGGIGVNENSG